MEIPIQNLRSLPAGAVYTKKNGSATVTAAHSGDTIFISALCDSLQQLVYEQEEMLYRFSEKFSEKEKEIKETRLKYFAYGILSGILLTLIVLTIIYLIKKK